MLPPAFTYFLDISEFLKIYPHIALKLAEDEKHLVQTFIDGKLEVASRKKDEAITTLQAEQKVLMVKIGCILVLII